MSQLFSEKVGAASEDKRPEAAAKTPRGAEVGEADPTQKDDQMEGIFSQETVPGTGSQVQALSLQQLPPWEPSPVAQEELDKIKEELSPEMREALGRHLLHQEEQLKRQSAATSEQNKKFAEAARTFGDTLTKQAKERMGPYS